MGKDIHKERLLEGFYSDMKRLATHLYFIRLAKVVVIYGGHEGDMVLYRDDGWEHDGKCEWFSEGLNETEEDRIGEKEKWFHILESRNDIIHRLDEKSVIYVEKSWLSKETSIEWDFVVLGEKERILKEKMKASVEVEGMWVKDFETMEDVLDVLEGMESGNPLIEEYDVLKKEESQLSTEEAVRVLGTL